ncbi:MAG: nucleotidyltransferase family protein [Rhodothermales bacterium]
MMPVVILCGGLGTRLRAVMDDRPKVLAPIEGEPFLGYVLHHLCRQGFDEVFLSTGYLGEMVADYAGDGARWQLQVQCVHEPAPLSTGGALRYVADKMNVHEPFLALNGDTFFSGSLARLVAFHASTPGAQASLALVQVPRADRYGIVQAESRNGAIRAFLEKPAGPAEPAWINAGVYVLAPALIEAIPADRNVSLERDVFPRWIGRGLYGCRFPEARFLDIGTPEEYAQAPTVLPPLPGRAP